MDLSTFSKETLINMIQDQQKLINELQKQINSYKIPKPQKVSSSDLYQVYNEDTKQITKRLLNNKYNINDHMLLMNETDRTSVGLLFHENIIDVLDKFPRI